MTATARPSIFTTPGRGRRIFDIARRYHARARDLAAANHLDTNGDPPQELTTDTACLLIPAAL